MTIKVDEKRPLKMARTKCPVPNATVIIKDNTKAQNIRIIRRIFKINASLLIVIPLRLPVSGNIYSFCCGVLSPLRLTAWVFRNMRL